MNNIPRKQYANNNHSALKNNATNFYVNMCNSARYRKMSPSNGANDDVVVHSSLSASTMKTKEQNHVWSVRILTVSWRRKLELYHYPRLFLVDIIGRFAGPFGTICLLTHVIIRALKNDINVRKRVIWTQVRKKGCF